MQNNKIKIQKTEILSDNWYTLRKITYDYLKKDGSCQTQSREAYDRGNGATILLYNTDLKTVIFSLRRCSLKSESRHLTSDQRH
jgi:GDP-mannose pyrophosphatase NudK